MREYPDAQWGRMRDEALANLRASAGNLLKKAPVLGNIQGGIVFSNPNAELYSMKSAIANLIAEVERGIQAWGVSLQ